MHLLIIRHAERRAGARDHDDLGLTPVGVTQAAALAEWLRRTGWRVDVLLSSTLPRAWQTAEAIATEFRVPALAEDRLREVGSCTPDGVPLADGAPAPYGFHPRAHRQRPVRPGGESWDQFTGRVAALLREILAQHGAVPNREVVLVGHSGVHNAVYELLCAPPGTRVGVELAVGPTGISHWEYLPGQGPEPWILRAHNLAYHLEDASRSPAPGVRG